MTLSKSLDRFSFASLTLPDLLEVPKGPATKWKRHLHSQKYPHRKSPQPSTSFITLIDFIQPTSIHPVFVLALKVFLFSIVYHLVEEKTSKSITGFNYSWYITLFELTCAFLLELIERLSIAYHEIASFDSFPSDLSTPHNDPHSQSHSPQTLSSSSSTDPDTTIIDIDDPSPSSIPSKSHSNALWRTVSALRSLSSDFHFRTSYLLLALNLILSRGLATIVLQYYDMDYPTYAICRNSKMVFVMALSVVWLRKPYRCSDWILVLLTSLSVLSFRLASHDLWFSSANTMGVPLLLLSTFLSAMDNSWKEKVTVGRGISPNEILFHINLMAIVILFVFLTVLSTEYVAATSFLLSNPSAMWWMILRGVSYSLWIHFSVVLIAKAGALINQYVSASRKLFSVVLSFVMFGRPFYLMHGVGFVLFATACALKVATAGHREPQSGSNAEYESVKGSDSECSLEDEMEDTAVTVTATKSKLSKETVIEEVDGSNVEERKHNGFIAQNIGKSHLYHTAVSSVTQSQ